MKNRNWKSLLTVAIVLTAAHSWAATCSVPTSGYPTIQSAVDDPTCTTINVAPGVYLENVTISRSLTLNGAQAGQPVASRTSAGPAESTVIGANPAAAHPVLAINAPTVTLDGFTIKNSVTTGAAIGVQVGAASDNAVIVNNFIDGITSADAAPVGEAEAIWIQNGSYSVNIGKNDVRNVTSDGFARGILIGDTSSTVNASDIVYMHENMISGITSATAGASAVVAAKISQTPTSFFLEQNQISDVTGGAFAHAVRIECLIVDAPIMNNDFSNLTSPSGDVVAIWFVSNTNGNAASIAPNNFNLTEAAYGIKIEEPFDNSVGPMAASCNWWGSPDGPGPVGPGHGARVSPNITYNLWRIVPGGGCVGNNAPVTEGDCKNGGWITHVRPDGSVFKSQGDCVQFLNTGK
jgi:hypothetical protein